MLRLILCDFACIQSRQAQIAGDISQEMTIGPQATSLHARLESPANISTNWPSSRVYFSQTIPNSQIRRPESNNFVISF
jgi:hypothetical protein